MNTTGIIKAQQQMGGLKAVLSKTHTKHHYDVGPDLPPFIKQIFQKETGRNVGCPQKSLCFSGHWCVYSDV